MDHGYTFMELTSAVIGTLLALANTDYAVVVTAALDALGTNALVGTAAYATTTGFQISVMNFGYNFRDAERISFVIFGSNVVGSSNVAVPTGGAGGGTVGFGNRPISSFL